jgi:hypothetical protein
LLDILALIFLVKTRRREVRTILEEESFTPKKEHATGIWRELHFQEIRDLYPLPNAKATILRNTRWNGHLAYN